MAYVFCISFRVRIVRRTTYRTYIRVDRHDFFVFYIRYVIRFILTVCLRGGCTNVAFSQDTRFVCFDGEDVDTGRQFTAARDECVDQDDGHCRFREVTSDIQRDLMLIR